MTEWNEPLWQARRRRTTLWVAAWRWLAFALFTAAHLATWCSDTSMTIMEWCGLWPKRRSCISCWVGLTVFTLQWTYLLVNWYMADQALANSMVPSGFALTVTMGPSGTQMVISGIQSVLVVCLWVVYSANRILVFVFIVLRTTPVVLAAMCGFAAWDWFDSPVRPTFDDGWEDHADWYGY